MASLFLPDPLCDPALVAALGLEPTGGQALSLAGYVLTQADIQTLPGLQREANAHCTGQVFTLPAGSDAALEVVFSVAGCDLVTATTEEQAVLVPLAQSTGAFDIHRWRARALSAWVAALPDLLSLQEKFSPADIAQRLPMILSRGNSRARAQATEREDRSGFTRDDVFLERQTQPYTEYFAVNEYLVRHRTYSGDTTGPLRRAVFMAVDAVTVLPYDPARDRVLLVEQFRAAPYARGDRHPWLLEPIAGRIEPGDTAEETAHKEAGEEAGLRLQALHRIGSYYPSTGCFSEYLVSFIGIADLPDTAEGLHGVEDEGEDIRTQLVSRADLLDRIAAGEMPDGPLLLSAYWLELNRARLQAG